MGCCIYRREPCFCCYAYGKTSENPIEPVAPKVPAITFTFWVIKLLTTGGGELISDFMGNISPALCGVVAFFGFILSMYLQFRAPQYDAMTYWANVMMIAVFGTAIADVFAAITTMASPYYVTAPVLSIANAYIFYTWYRLEGTLSIHAITSRRREGFYWWAVFCTFTLGTALGDFTAYSPLNLGFRNSILIYLGLISMGAVFYGLQLCGVRINPVFTFWYTYVLTRPLGASIVDYLSKDASETCGSPFGDPVAAGTTCKYGNSLGLGDGYMSLAFGGAFVVLVAIQAIFKRDIQEPFESIETSESKMQSPKVNPSVQSIEYSTAMSP